MHNSTPPSAKTMTHYVGKWCAISALIAAMAGSASSLLLFSLDWATHTREAHRWIIALLPIGGFAIGWIYLKFGHQVEGGNNLLIDQIHDPKQIIPLRMAPFVFVGTVVSQLFGASVGREGTAVQMAGALADQITHHLKIEKEDRRLILMAGISAGFSSVFGTPMAGWVFGIEVLATGRMRYEAIFPCLLSAILANQIGDLWGVHHTTYLAGAVPAMTVWGFVATLIAGAAFGLAGQSFAKSTHLLTSQVKRLIKYAPLRPLIGGAVIGLSVWLFSADRYIGLGIPTIVSAFEQPLAFYDFLCKGLFTIASLGTGFKGGEVTPLFYIGATLGNTLAQLLNMPIALMAALGFVAVFGGAANTPISATLMAMELFGAEIAPYAAIASVVSYLCSGQSGIYHSQRNGHAKP